MVILRPTQKLQAALPTSVVSAQSDTALGDWYVNRIVVHRQPLLLLVSSCSPLPEPLPGAVEWDLWTYTPALILDGDTVAPLSLTLSLLDRTDERVQLGLDALTRQFPW